MKKGSGRNRKNKQRRGEENRAEPPPPSHHFLIKLTSSPDLRFPHLHLRWRASTATYTADGATRRRSDARRRTGGTKAVDRRRS